MTTTQTKPWEWRIAAGGWILDTDIEADECLFHAYDVNDTAACEPACLVQSAKPVTEGSDLCPACIEFLKANPAGRERRVPR